MKGFTLIELLAVIVILAIIVLIALPLINDVIENSKISSFKNSVGMIKESARLDYIKSLNEGEELAVEYTFTNGVISSNVPGKMIEFSGKKPVSGKIIVSNTGVVTFALHDGKYCATEESGEVVIDQITSQACIDIIEPLPETAEYKYIYDVASVIENATPCTIGGKSFTHILDKRDGKTYAVTKVGTQCWQANNLAYAPASCLSATWDNTAPHNACRTNGGSSWDKDEVLYQWSAAMNGSTTQGAQGMCLTGWHIATDPEWQNLEISMGMTPIQANATDWRGSTQGQKLKSTTPAWGGIQPVGFNAKPVGYRGVWADINGINTEGYWWTSSYTGALGWRRNLNDSEARIFRDYNTQALGHSVRCIMN